MILLYLLLFLQGRASPYLRSIRCVLFVGSAKLWLGYEKTFLSRTRHFVLQCLEGVAVEIKDTDGFHFGS